MTAIDLSSYIALLALTLLTINILLGLLISVRYSTLRSWPHRQINIFALHNWTGYTALCVTGLHPVVLLFSKTAGFRWPDLLWPLHSPSQPLINSFGAAAFYCLAIVVVTSYFRVELGRKLWKRLHYTAYAAAALFFTHGILTDPELKNRPTDFLDVEKVFIERMLTARAPGRWLAGALRTRKAEPGMRAFAILLLLGLSVETRAQTERPTDKPSTPPANTATAGSATLTGPTDRRQGWSYDPDAGAMYQHGDYRWTSWGYGEHAFRPEGDGFWRRVRQGMEFDLPRFAPHYRAALVYEVDFTDTNFFRDRSKLNIVENFFAAIQDADNPGKIRVLFGENTHILSREDNLSSGNLPTINRSLILEEHGSVHSFGTQFGVELVKAVTPRYTVAVSALDNRGSLNTSNPRYVVGNDLAVKVSGLLIDDEKRGRKLYAGAALDQTRDIHNGTWTFISAVAGQSIGTAPASGNKNTGEVEANYTDLIGKHPYSLESEHFLSLFSKTDTHIAGGYGLGQFSLFHTAKAGDLDPFVRYDWVHLSANGFETPILQQAVRAGFNWNLPGSREHVSFHLEYSRNLLRGPAIFMPTNVPSNELGLGTC